MTDMASDNSERYAEYLEVSDGYFPSANAQLMAKEWDNTYPHKTMVKILGMALKMLEGHQQKAMWVEGTYGTGKSRCVLALRYILESDEARLRQYWNKYETLRGDKTDLLPRLEAQKRQGVVVAFRDSSSGVSDEPRLWFNMVQECVLAGLEAYAERSGREVYRGEATLAQLVTQWFGSKVNRQYFDQKMAEYPDEALELPVGTADAILAKLEKGNSVELIRQLVTFGNTAGITYQEKKQAFNNELLHDWLADIIKRNEVKIVFIWDEFSDYLDRNRFGGSQFQKLVELAQEMPFYMVVVAHKTASGASYERLNNAEKIKGRFEPITVSMPDDIALQLIGAAITVKPGHEDDWRGTVRESFRTRLMDSRKAVLEMFKRMNKEGGAESGGGLRVTEDILQDMLPIHPMTALVMKNMSQAFAYNQRSMFEFMKDTSKEDVEAFQWYIESHGPLDAHPLLTVDMLWSYFYEQGKYSLPGNVQQIFEVYGQQEHSLADDKQRMVLKAVLLMQGVVEAMGGRFGATVDLLYPTKENLNLVFEGVSDIGANEAVSIAEELRQRGILISKTIKGSRWYYAAEISVINQEKIREIHDRIIAAMSTKKLVEEGELAASVMQLPVSLKLRQATLPSSKKDTVAWWTATAQTLRKQLSNLRSMPVEPWQYKAILLFAKDRDDREKLQAALSEELASGENGGIVIVDASSNLLDDSAWRNYLDNAAKAEFYSSHDQGKQSEFAAQARRILREDWARAIRNGGFTICAGDVSYEESGENNAVSRLLKLAAKRFPNAFEFGDKSLREACFKTAGYAKTTVQDVLNHQGKGFDGDLQKVLGEAWQSPENYWKTAPHAVVSQIKARLDEYIEGLFGSNGTASFADIWRWLMEQYGFAPCNLYLALTGFLLRQYSGGKYRYKDDNSVHEPMTALRLAEALATYFKKFRDDPRHLPDMYIVKMTKEERDFYRLTEQAWHLPKNSLASLQTTGERLAAAMHGLKFPVWCLLESPKVVAAPELGEVLDQYIQLVQTRDTSEQQRLANALGGRYTPELADSLGALLKENECQDTMKAFLGTFDEGGIFRLAEAIGVSNGIMLAVQRVFDADNSYLWNRAEGEKALRDLEHEYSVIDHSNRILNVAAKSKAEMYSQWRQRLDATGTALADFRDAYQPLAPTLNLLGRLYGGIALAATKWRSLTVCSKKTSTLCTDFWVTATPCSPRFTRISCRTLLRRSWRRFARPCAGTKWCARAKTARTDPLPPF